MQKPTQLKFIYNKSNKFTSCQILNTKKIEFSIKEDSSLKYQKFDIFLQNYFLLLNTTKDSSKSKLLAKIYYLYNDNKIVYSTFYQIVKNFKKPLIKNKSFFKILTEFSLESGLSPSVGTSINFIKKLPTRLR